MTGPAEDPRVMAWLAEIEARHLADLSFPEVRRGVQALSALYLERRRRLSPGAPLDGAGKRAAFALFYGPLHFLALRGIVRGLGAAVPPPSRILDLGCGTGAAGAAWALDAGGLPFLDGVERHPWAIRDANRTWHDLGLRGRARRGDALRARPAGAGDAVLAAYLANELPDAGRARLLGRLLESAGRGARVLVVEPIATRVSPWWNAWSAAFRAAGGRADEWRFPAELPDLLARLDRAAGLDHREITARTLWLRSAPEVPMIPASGDPSKKT